ncbi:RHS repeat domain-containing protein [Paenibacillus durus]|uniref:RHS repeat domain-containing protein n=1 Tax=Paenibacillus durus TaxID=44251 RepID=UPI0005A6323C|nr:RHS repeat domain-containing protein [Paenibacillus durus]
MYNGHGDVVALTDAEGKVAARYEYDVWRLVTGMYNRYGERVREGIGWMGDLGSGNGSPGSLQGPEDESGNIDPDYHPGNGNANGKGNSKAKSKPSEEQTVTLAAAEETVTDTSAGITDLVTEEVEPTEDITTELVKENPVGLSRFLYKLI